MSISRLDRMIPVAVECCDHVCWNNVKVRESGRPANILSPCGGCLRGNMVPMDGLICRCAMQCWVGTSLCALCHPQTPETEVRSVCCSMCQLSTSGPACQQACNPHSTTAITRCCGKQLQYAPFAAVVYTPVNIISGQALQQASPCLHNMRPAIIQKDQTPGNQDTWNVPDKM